MRVMSNPFIFRSKRDAVVKASAPIVIMCIALQLHKVLDESYYPFLDIFQPLMYIFGMTTFSALPLYNYYLKSEYVTGSTREMKVLPYLFWFLIAVTWIMGIAWLIH